MMATTQRRGTVEDFENAVQHRIDELESTALATSVNHAISDADALTETITDAESVTNEVSDELELAFV